MGSSRSRSVLRLAEGAMLLAGHESPCQGVCAKMLPVHCHKGTNPRCPSTHAPPTGLPPMRHLLAFKPLERLAVDFLKLDRGHGGFEDVLVMTDSFTKFARTKIRLLQLWLKYFVTIGLGAMVSQYSCTQIRDATLRAS